MKQKQLVDDYINHRDCNITRIPEENINKKWVHNQLHAILGLFAQNKNIIHSLMPAPSYYLLDIDATKYQSCHHKNPSLSLELESFGKIKNQQEN